MFTIFGSRFVCAFVWYHLLIMGWVVCRTCWLLKARLRPLVVSRLLVSPALSAASGSQKGCWIASRMSQMSALLGCCHRSFDPLLAWAAPRWPRTSWHCRYSWSALPLQPKRPLNRWWIDFCSSPLYWLWSVGPLPLLLDDPWRNWASSSCSPIRVWARVTRMLPAWQWTSRRGGSVAWRREWSRLRSGGPGSDCGGSCRKERGRTSLEAASLEGRGLKTTWSPWLWLVGGFRCYSLSPTRLTRERKAQGLKFSLRGQTLA